MLTLCQIAFYSVKNWNSNYLNMVVVKIKIVWKFCSIAQIILSYHYIANAVNSIKLRHWRACKILIIFIRVQVCWKLSFDWKIIHCCSSVWIIDYIIRRVQVFNSKFCSSVPRKNSGCWTMRALHLRFFFFCSKEAIFLLRFVEWLKFNL